MIFFKKTYKMKKGENMYTYIDLFSGSGGLSLGFDNAGFKNLFSVDIEPDFCKTYQRNFPNHRLLNKDIAKLTEQEIIRLLNGKSVDVVIGGPPCQGFSIAGSIGRRFIDDPRNHLFKEFARVVSIVKPKIFVMENVSRLYTHNHGNTRKEILGEFEKIGYSVICQVLNTADFGVPQQRRRIIFIGTSLKEVNLKFPSPTHSSSEYVTIKDAIQDLPVLKSGEESTVPNHNSMKHTQQMLEKMAFVKDGGDRLDIPEKIRPQKGDVRKYIRYDSSKPSICITGDMRKVFHYEQNRALTVRELARIQTYPDDFIFEGNVISQQQQVGNSVPPLFAFTLAKNVLEILEDA